MKYRVTLLLSLGLAAAQAGSWIKQSPLPSGTDFYTMDFIDDKVGWVAGRNEAWKTIDGGSNWSLHPQAPKLMFYHIHFVSPDSGYAMGAMGSTDGIFATRDGGQTWVQQTQGNNFNAGNIAFFLDSRRGVAVGEGGAIVTTENGGASWEPRQSGTLVNLSSVHLVRGVGYAVGGGGPMATDRNGIILRTLDSGKTWSSLTAPATSALLSVHFADERLGLASGYNGLLLRTKDGGENWHADTLANNPALHQVHFQDAKSGWVIGEGGLILKTDNGGESWASQQSGTTLTLRAIASNGKGRAWIAGERGALLRTEDGGDSWSASANGTGAALCAVTSLGSGRLLAFGGNGVISSGMGAIVRSTDGGAAWRQLPFQLPGFASYTLQSSSFWSGTEGVAVGFGWELDGISDSGSLVFKTADGGVNWLVTRLYNPSGNRTLHAVDCPSENACYGVGYWGTILKSADKGASWNPQEAGTTKSLNAVHFLDDRHGYAVGGGGNGHDTDGGIVLMTKDGGESWVPKRDTALPQVHAVWFKNESNGWIGGDGIYRTYDGGKQWRRVSPLPGQTPELPQNYTIQAIRFSSPTVAYAVGWSSQSVGRIFTSHGIVFESRDGGENWVLEKFPEVPMFNAISSDQEGNVWVAGSNGNIFKQAGANTSVGEGRWQRVGKSHSTLDAEGLRFRLDASAKVKVVLRRVDGRLVANLGDRRYPAGAHTFGLHNQPLPAGNYILELAPEPGVREAWKLSLP